jgi:DNA (cytosine-5)-methyltransferase 1
MKHAYYNEIDPYAAAWLRNLISAGHIAPGDVDERSIEDVRPDDLRGYAQCHFFAGIGTWSYALRLAGWPDDRPVWTGSCPCQPFSAAGKGAGFDDERHLWPDWYWLIGECRPPAIFGEQVASKAVEPWIDLVFTDLEAIRYACGADPFPSAGVGAPHIRDRSFFVADADNARLEGRVVLRECTDQRSARSSGVAGIVADTDSSGRPARGEGCEAVGYGATVESDCSAGRLADADSRKRDGLAVVRGAERDGADSGRAQGCGEPESCGDVCELADTDIIFGRQGREIDGRRHPGSDAQSWPGSGGHGVLDRIEPAGPTNGFWRDADWLLCRDGKWRPVEPGTFPLAHGTAGGVGRVRADQERLAALVPRKDQGSRTGRLRGYGNTINPWAAKAFIEACEGW